MGRVHAVVECPAGSAVKLKLDPDRGGFVWSRGLPAGVSFPHDFGFVPRTLAGDGDALDALILGASAGFPGVIVPSRVLGALRLYQTRDGGPEKENHRLLLVPSNEHRLAHLREPDDLGARHLTELEAFFRASLALTRKRIRLDGWTGAAEAESMIDSAHQRWQGDRR